MSKLRLNEPSLIERIVLKLLSRLTFTTTGLRIDAGGSSVVASIAASQTLATVGTVGASNNVSLGRATADGMGIQMSYLAYQQGFRKNLVVT